MKKFFFFILILLLAISTSGYAKPWWRYALADAGGAATGALGGLAGGPVVAGLMAIAGGCAATLATAIEPPPTSGSQPLLNPRNAFDYVGATHNKIIYDFYKDKVSRTDMPSLFRFILKRENTYGFNTNGITDSSLLKITEQIKGADLTNSDGIIKHLGTLLPKAIKVKFKVTMDRILATNSLDEFNKIILNEENRIIDDNSLTEKSRTALKCYFSTLRHSAAIWAPRK